MAVQTTRNATLFCNGSPLGKVISASIDISLEAMETTTVEKYFRTYVPGINGATASVTLLYDPNDANTVSLLSSVLTGTIVTLSFVINTTLTTTAGLPPKSSTLFTAFVTQSSIPFAVREAVAISLSLQVTGTITQSL
jgi:hypothetical protein